MGLIEEALRDTLAAQVGTAPVVDDPAGRAIEAAGRFRRRRALAGVLAVAASVAFVAGGVAVATQPSHQGAAERRPVAPVPPPPLDVRTGTSILTTDGRTISLAQRGPVAHALRVEDGWLVTTAGPPGQALYHIDDGGTATWLTVGDRILVAPDGRRVAWSADGGVWSGERAGQKLTTNHHTSGTGTLEPVAFAGGGLVLGTRKGTSSGYDMWYPAAGGYVTAPRTNGRVAAATADGTQVFALIGSTYPCLAVLDPPLGLSMVRRACDLSLALDHTLVPSPDGRWLLVLAPDRIDLYDLGAVWRLQAPVASWTVVAQHAAWLTDGQFVLNGHGELLRGYVETPGRLDEIAVGPEADGDVIPIPVARP